jgi:hypothetical protein
MRAADMPSRDRTFLGAAETLRLWERAKGLGPTERAVLLAAGEGDDAVVLSTAPVGVCNRRLVDFRSSALGPVLAATAQCPACSSRVEFQLTAPALLQLDPARRPGGVTASADGRYVVTWRLPTPSDLSYVADRHVADPATALTRRCLAATDGEGREIDPAQLPPGTLSDVEQAMADADPLAEVLVSLICPECGTAFDADVDIASFVWSEVEARALRVLHDVGVLAGAYGWSEPEVLALSEPRRAAYLRLVLEGAP